MWICDIFILVLLIFLNSMKLFIYIVAITLVFTGKSYAYLDPGSYGLIQMLLAALAGVFASLMIYWNKFKQFVNKIFKKKPNKDQHS